MLVLAFVAPWFNVPRDQADTAGMMAHLHGHFVDADLLYDDEYAALGMSGLFAFVTREGVVSNHWPTGATWLQAPGYALGLLANRGLAALGVARFDALGVVPLLAVRAWAMLVLVAMTFAWARAVARASGSIGGGVLAGVAFAIGTPLLYYASEAPLRPHLFGAAVVLAFVLLWHADEGREASTLRPVVLGALAGLAAGVRPQLAPLVVLALEDAWRTSERGERVRTLVLTLAAFCPWPLVHLRHQLWMYGSDLGDYGRPLTHHLAAFLASPYHGALVWCPVLALGAVLVVRSAVLRERGSWIVLAVLAHQVWIDSGMRDIEPYRVLGTQTWAGGVAFGPRKLVDVLPLVLPAVLSFVAAHRGAWGRRGVAVLVGALIVPTAWLHVAAVVAPEATTGAVLDGRGLSSAFALVLDARAWSLALQHRHLPLAVPLVVTLVVSLPLLLALVVLARWIAAVTTSTALRVGLAVVLGCAGLVHLWIAVLQVRSDMALAEDPLRMDRARARMHGPHEQLVARIPAHHETLRAILGPHAAPEPRRAPEPPRD